MNNDFCEKCFMNYTKENPQFEDYPICVMCASKIAVMVLAETVSVVMSKRIK